MECPLPLSRYPAVTLAHGAGGRLSSQLVRDLFAAALPGDGLEREHDAAVLPGAARLAFTTDSYVVRPLFFAGGDIGRLAVFGTVNDLLVAGAAPAYLSVAAILEEGLPMETLWRVACAIGDAAREAGVRVVTGDTKVVERGKADGVYLTTSGVGLFDAECESEPPHPRRVRAGDAVLVSGDLGRHGVAVLLARGDLHLDADVHSDCAPLVATVAALRASGADLHCLRDLTRGGLAAACWEIATSAGLGMRVVEDAVPVDPAVRAACELLGLSALHVANEGRLLAIVPAGDAERTLAALRSAPGGKHAAHIGVVTPPLPFAPVHLETPFGSTVTLELPSGEQLPRIC
jgi:hydrogenase expression/formation protein HypE